MSHRNLIAGYRGNVRASTSRSMHFGICAHCGGEVELTRAGNACIHGIHRVIGGQVHETPDNCPGGRKPPEPADIDEAAEPGGRKEDT